MIKAEEIWGIEYMSAKSGYYRMSHVVYRDIDEAIKSIESRSGNVKQMENESLTWMSDNNDKYRIVGLVLRDHF